MPTSLSSKSAPSSSVTMANALSDVIEEKLKAYFEALDGQCPSCNLHAAIMAQVEKPLIKVIMGHAKGNKVQAAEMLGISRNTLSKKIKDYQL